RSARRKVWSSCPLSYEEVAEPAVMSLDLQPASVTQPEPIAAAFRIEAPLFSEVSRGLLPQEWVEEVKSERRSPSALLETCVEDVRYALRLIRRTPLLSAVIVLTLTVGIGINASVFTVVNGLELRPHVYKDPDTFIRVIPTSRLQGRPRQVSYEEYVA